MASTIYFADGGGSALGALLLLNILVNALQLTIAIAMIAVAVFSLLNKNKVMTPQGGPPSGMAEFAGFEPTFLVAVYGGFFSGGYVTVLTAVFAALFGIRVTNRTPKNRRLLYRSRS